MNRKIVVLSVLAASVAVASPAMAWTWKPVYKPPVTSSGGAPSSSGGHSVPEPGMLGLMGAGLVGLAIARRRKARR